MVESSVPDTYGFRKRRLFFPSKEAIYQKSEAGVAAIKTHLPNFMFSY